MINEPGKNEPDERLEQFSAQLASCQAQLFAYAFAIVQNMADAEDICQRSYVILWQKFDLFEEGTSFYAWALKITHFEALNFVRRRRRERLFFCEETILALAKTQNDQAETDAHAARSTILQGCLKKLPKHHLQLIRLHYNRDRSIGEIAASLNRTENAIRSALSRARKALRECVEGVVTEETA